MLTTSLLPLRTRQRKEFSIVTVVITSHCIGPMFQSGFCCQQEKETALPQVTHDLSRSLFSPHPTGPASSVDMVDGPLDSRSCSLIALPPPTLSASKL